jgi:hypothetical protein
MNGRNHLEDLGIDRSLRNKAGRYGLDSFSWDRDQWHALVDTNELSGSFKGKKCLDK